MAVGDIVNGCSSTTTITFQPALGVTVCITSTLGGDGGYIYQKITDGVNTATSRNYPTQTPDINVKIMISNSVYLLLASSGSGIGYSGIQLT